MKYFVLYFFHQIVGYGLMIHLDIFTFGECFGYDIMIYLGVILRLGDFLHFSSSDKGNCHGVINLRNILFSSAYFVLVIWISKCFILTKICHPMGYYLVTDRRKAWDDRILISSLSYGAWTIGTWHDWRNAKLRSNWLTIQMSIFC